MFFLIDGVRDDNPVEGTGVDTFNSISTENTMSHQSIDLGRTLIFEELRSTRDCI